VTLGSQLGRLATEIQQPAADLSVSTLLEYAVDIRRLTVIALLGRYVRHGSEYVRNLNRVIGSHAYFVRATNVQSFARNVT
jgi:hypothetical protein